VEQKRVKTNPDGSVQVETVPNSARRYADKELPITVEDDMDEMQITLSPVPVAGP